MSGGVGAGDFAIVNDAYTNANLCDWYFEVGGLDYTNLANPFYQSTAFAVPLPVQLTSFSAQLAASRKVDLSWKTATAIDLAGPAPRLSWVRSP